ncbi:hypothetical protein B484DRAFT_248364 [Ochromonadaceae sp. CCMP2298]|nr:hypothetical protein B484DRAFT_248364 [Ochromonadaceae sp. CCMP2298]
MRHMGCNSDDEQRSSAADIDQQLQIAGAQDDGKQAVGGAGLSGGAKSERRGQQKYTNAPPSEGQGGTEEGGRERKDSVILGKGGSSGGLAALARSGQLFNTRSVFDLEVRHEHGAGMDCGYAQCSLSPPPPAFSPPPFSLQIIGPDEKALIAVGDTWEWTPSKRLLLNVTEASLFHMKRSTIVAKFSAAQIAAMPALKCLRFVFDDFATLKSVSARKTPAARCLLSPPPPSSLDPPPPHTHTLTPIPIPIPTLSLQVEFIPQMYGHLVEHLTVKNCPLCTATSPKLLRSYFIASMPRLLSFNDVQVSADDRRVSESLYMPLIRMQQICPPAPSPAIAAAAPAPPGSSNGGVKVGSPQKQSSQQQSLLRVHQAQATRQLMQSFYVVGGPEADLQNQQALEQGPGTAAATTGSVTAELLSNMGSGSPWDVQPAGTQLGFSGAEAGVAASGLSGRALQRRRCSQAFEAAFDSLVLKVLQETLVEMKQLAR